MWYDECYDEMVIIGMIKINFLSGMMGIKNAKPKKHKLRKS